MPASRSRFVAALAAVLVAVLAAAGAVAEEAPHLALLPPETPWDGASRALAVAPDDPWATPFERGGMVDSPDDAATVAWLERLAAASPQVHMVALGASPEGRTIWLVVASREGATSPAELAANGRPTLLAQGGIHSGEIDGKDAGMMLLRDLTVGGSRAELLDRANFLLVPIFNVDGHERRGPHGRINQRGPATVGWRTNSRNLNLNRDYAKADTLEMRHLLAALAAWQPDLYLDLHVTDGEDYQYDVTYGWNGPHAWSPAIAGWLDAAYGPAVAAALEAAGHTPGPLTFGVDPMDFAQGIFAWTAPPRFSNGYGDARHLPTVLVENHSLKSFDRRVLGTYVLLAESLRVLGERGGELRQAVAADRARRPATVPLAFAPPSDAPPPTRPFRGVRHRLELSEISGGPVVRWTGELRDYPALPVVAATVPAVTVTRPAAYLVPPAYRDVIERLAAHGIAMEVLDAPRELAVEMYRLDDPELAAEPFEGRVMVTATPRVEVRTETFLPGTVRVPTDQPLGDLAVLLLEPAAPDSFFQWGFFHEVLARTEYVEAYVMEPMARRMLDDDPALRAEYLAALAADEALRTDPAARLQWFYERTPYFDDCYRLYPVARVP